MAIVFGPRSVRCLHPGMNARAVTYRRLHTFRNSLRTAVMCRRWVRQYGRDLGRPALAFTRTPSNGASKLYGDSRINAQGEAWSPAPHDRRTSPTEYARQECRLRQHDGSRDARRVHGLTRIYNMLEKHYRDLAGHGVHGRAGSCGCCRPAAASHARRRCASPASSPMKA